MTRIHLSSPDVTDLEEQALVRAIRSGWVAPLGPEVDAFERELAEFSERRHCVALSSGTAALHLALLTLGVGPGDLVLTSSMTFVATANAISYTGAVPVFIDADSSGNMSPALLAEAFSDLADEGLAARLVLPVDVHGKVTDHARIGAIAAEYGVPVVSDAAESVGAVRDGRPSGSYGLLATLSFNGNKVMTTSGGGALLTDDAKIAQRVRYLATQARQPVVHYEHTDIGYNYRLSNILAALGRAQLERLESMIERRRQHRLRYAEFFADVPGVTLFGQNDGRACRDHDDRACRDHDNFWLTSVLVDPDAAGFTAEDLRLALAAEDIESRPLWKPMHLQPVFAGARAYVDGTSERLFRTGLSLPSGSVLTDADMDRIHGVIGDFLRRSSSPRGTSARGSSSPRGMSARGSSSPRGTRARGSSSPRGTSGRVET